MNEEKKVGIISLYYNNPNCGGLLQAYAMCKAVEKKGCQGEQICHDRTIPVKCKKYQRIIYEATHSDSFTALLKEFRKLVLKKRLSSSVVEERTAMERRFTEFAEKIPHSKKTYNVENIEESIDEYTCFISGSDQVWSWNYGYKGFYDKFAYKIDAKYKQNLDINFLRFVPDLKKKIAYAPSIACPTIPPQLQDYYHDSLERFDFLSIREKDSLSILPQDISCRTKVVVDPTMLLSAGEWKESLALNDSKTNGFIFVYMFSPTKEDIVKIKAISKYLGLPIIYNPAINIRNTSVYYGWGGIEDFDMGPREFVEYIMNASLVLTNSFHAAVFSIQFHTPFYIFKRENKVSMHSRIDSLASDYHLERRILPINCDLERISKFDEISWDQVDSELEKKRYDSLFYLENALEESI